MVTRRRLRVVVGTAAGTGAGSETLQIQLVRFRSCSRSGDPPMTARPQPELYLRAALLEVCDLPLVWDSALSDDYDRPLG